MKERLKVWLFPLMTAFVITACSNNDGDVWTPELDMDPAQDYNGITVKFETLNMDGIAVNSFREGENIIFSLTITNNREQQISLPHVKDMFGDIAFPVYSENNEEIGVAGRYVRTWSLDIPRLSTGRSFIIRYPWYMTDQNLPGLTAYYSFFVKDNPGQSLRKGKYYSEFEFFLEEGQKVVCRKDFRVE